MNADKLRTELEQLVAAGVEHIRSDRVRRITPLARAGGLEACLRLATVALVILGLAKALGLGAPAWPIAIGVVLACIGLVALVRSRAKHLPVTRGDALALWDRAAGLEDRLLAADEFLRADMAGADPAFVAAALEDAAQHIGRAGQAKLETELPEVEFGGRAVRAALAIALLCGLDLLPERGEENDPEPPIEVAGGKDIVPAGPGEEPPPSTEPDSVEPDDPKPEEEERPDDPAATTASAATSPGELSDRVKESAGKTGQGKSADASASSKASDAKGAPSGQSQTSQGTAKKEVPAEKKPKKPATPPEAGKRKPNEENSGSTAGQGSSKGSSKNPAATDWSSKDQVSTPDDAEIEDDEETQDEEEEQESRGGVQPSLRDRRPPVSRDLRIGFGNRPNPDANGRGGPSAPKKSRGVASLVLGVPVPDRVKGQPNPGKTKITQERIEPREEEMGAFPSTSRGQRDGMLGSLGAMDMSPWMRDLVREYFRRMRDEG